MTDHIDIDHIIDAANERAAFQDLAVDTAVEQDQMDRHEHLQ